MIEYHKLSLAIVIFLCQYSLSNKQTKNFIKDYDERYNIKDTLSILNKNTNIPIVKSKLNETHAYTSLPPRRQEQKGSVTRKQYEIINMLWRKTKFFVDFDDKPTPKLSLKNNRSTSDDLLTKISHIQQLKQNNLHQINPKLSSSTPSFIEFYYLDELDGYLKKKGYVLHSDKKFVNSRMGNKVLEKPKSEIFRQPVFAFDSRSNNEHDKDTTNVNLDTEEHQNHFNVPQLNRMQNVTTKVYNNWNSPKIFATQILTENDINESQWLSLFFSDPLSKHRAQIFTKAEISSESSTTNDKIKFFELYDSNTVAITKGTHFHPKTLDSIIKTHLQNNKVYNNNTPELNIVNKSEIVARSSRNLGNKKRDVLSAAYKNFNIPQAVTKHRSQSFTNKKKIKVWSEYPYTSVYIYEPLSIYCDAAAINAYWLIAAGSCLSHHQNNKLLNERSAYIAYCGDDWWEPESIVYVRRSIIHPSYRNRDKKRRHLYNIGVVQVITSLINNCNGWAPVSLVAHKFSVNEKGFPALALGWGLDTYSGKYSYYHIAKHSLAAYKGTLYPKSCPDTSSYRNVLYKKGVSETNIFCLSLPYKNISHGSLLLADGKLIALRLQRRKGLASEVSMQYTGIWRLIPWIQDLTHNASEQIRKSYDKILK